MDISSSYIENDRYGYRYKEPIIQLEMICTCLVNLTHLDISGTNLAVINPRTNEIEGLSLLPSPLEFLGIYKNEIPDSVKNIPAKMVKKIGRISMIEFFSLTDSRKCRCVSNCHSM